jgi:hypothetical protein
MTVVVYLFFIKGSIPSNELSQAGNEVEVNT